MTAPPAPVWPEILTRWDVVPPVVVLLALAVGIFARGREAAGSSGTRFAAGLGVIAVALLSPLATYAHALLWAHMVQHLLLVLVAAPLLVAARPGPALLAGLGRPTVPALVRRAARAATNPVAAWTQFAAVAWAVHFTPLFDLALRHDPVHAVEHALFLGSGIVFWYPVVGPRPVSHPVRLLYLVLAMPQNTFLALAIFSAGHPLYPAYEELARTWGPAVLDDQRLGGGLMWVAGDLTLLVAVLAVAAAWAASERAATPG